MTEFIENIGDYFSQHFFDDDFSKKVFDKSVYGADHIKEFNKKVQPLSEKYYKFKSDLLNFRRTEDKVKRTHIFHTELLNALGYINGTEPYDEPVVMDDNKIIPVRFRFHKNNKPFLYIMEMQAMIQEGDIDPDGLYEQSYIRKEWQSVLPNNPQWNQYDIRPEVIKEALSELFLLPEEKRPTYLIMLAGPKIFLIQYEKWKFDSYLLIDLEVLFTEAKTPQNKNYLALFYALLAKKQFISETESILKGLEEDAHKASYGVTVTLKSAVIYAVEALANEAINFRLNNAITLEEKQKINKQLENENFARELKDECLNFVYRLLFIFYAESRADLEILPVKDATYQKGYSLEMLRDLEMVKLTTDSSLNGYFFSESLWKLFDFMHQGSTNDGGFDLQPLDSPMFDNDQLKHLQGVQFRNVVLKEIVLRLSLSKRTNNKRVGRISYSNLGINQLGSVYESLLAYSGFFAGEDLIEVKNANDKNGNGSAFLVPKSRRDDFKEKEILKKEEHPEQDVLIEKGHFVYRLNGRDRKNSASYYTPEVLTHCTVKYTLKGIIDRLKVQQAFVDGILTGTPCADEILELKILEPAMGAAAFHNEVINQLSVAYLELKEAEQQAIGRKRITPGDYKDELQKVKALIAANNVYGVDLNPTAVELGKLSLWLNCMHKNMETPFFAHRLGAGNAVVGAWLKVYDEKDIEREFAITASGAISSKPIMKSWWEKAPKRIRWKKNGTLSRKQGQIYHFLLPDDNMVPSFGIKLLKEELTDAEIDGFKNWRSGFKKPLTKTEIIRLGKICDTIDVLLEDHYKSQKGMIADTSSIYPVYGQPSPQTATKGYDEKERLTESRKDRQAPYYKLKTILDYWCSLWFWDVRDVTLLPKRTEWYNEIESILQIDSAELKNNADAQSIKEQIRNKARGGTLFDNPDRLIYVQALAEQHRFFHNEIEFVEVFKERGGFDVIVGNPPWLKLTFEEKSIISENYPELELRGASASKVVQFRRKYFESENYKNQYLKENIAIDSASNFMNGRQNYPLLKGQQTNLYKCIVENGLSLTSPKGFLGLLHPDSIYDDPRGQLLRKEIYPRLKYHFHFQNKKMLFSEIKDKITYGVNVYYGSKGEVNFDSISNLYHPSTIYQSYKDSGSKLIFGMKKKNDATGIYEWNVEGYKSRIINYDADKLSSLKEIFNQSDSKKEVKLVSIYSKESFDVLEKLEAFANRLSGFNHKISEGLHETNEQYSIENQTGLIKEEVTYPKIEEYQLVYSGPHFFVANPLYRSPQEIVNNHNDFDVLDLMEIEKDFVPRTKYIPAQNLDEYAKGNGYFNSELWIENYKLACSKMIDSMSERTLQSCIIPPKVSHINGVISVSTKKSIDLVELAGLTHSTVLDFYLKTMNVTNLTDSRLNTFPLGIDTIFRDQLVPRVLRLNCLNTYYSDLWDELFQDDFKDISWYKDDFRLSSYILLTNKWNAEITPFRNHFERREALVEIDVIVAMALKLSLEDLISIFKIQFSVFEKFEDNTFYDSNGKIVFNINHQGLKAVGVDSKIWNEIKDLKTGETHVHTIEKSELYNGRQITYHAPFDKCDRVDDYKNAWAHFEKVFNLETI
ncbi:Eco57I restriction-modification methylase domain-containing protein [Gillisia sp. Q332]|uniref:Eco57I restriction-modification methylase domain-containing protein n=1 Tax=Gillisia xinjiangensis TaxID=3384765 RepID=UPI00391ACAE3